MNNSKNLNEIENEMLLVLKDGKSYWTKCYQLMKIVETEKLFLQANYHSFTAWLNAFQYKAGVNVRILWQQKKAGSFYESYREKNTDSKKNLPDINHVKITPTNLNYIEKISESHPWLEDKLMKQAIEGHITRRELKNTWECIKSERVAKGEVVARETRYDKAMITPVIERKLSATKALLSIQSDHSWLSHGKLISSDRKYHVYGNYEFHHSDNDYQWDILIAETISAEKGELHIHGLLLFGHDTELESETLQEYQKFVDYLWLLVPRDYEDDASIPEDVGILAVDPNSMEQKITVIHPAPRNIAGEKITLISDMLIRYLKSI